MKNVKCKKRMVLNNDCHTRGGRLNLALKRKVKFNKSLF